MADPEDEGKTEEPTDKRLQKLKEEGNTIQSQEFGSLGGMLATYIIFTFLIPFYVTNIGEKLKGLALTFNTFGNITTESLVMLFRIVFLNILSWVFLVGLVPVIFKFATEIIMHGWVWNPKKAWDPKLSNLSPLNGAKKLNAFSPPNLVKNGMSFVKLIVLSLVLGWYIYTEIPKFSDVITNGIIDSLLYLNHLVKVSLVIILLFMLILGVSDWRYRVMKYMNDNKMSKHEVKDEHKNTEGDPLVKRKIRSIRMQRHQERLVQFSSRADVLITNPTHFAVGLEYKPDTMNAPVVVALGQDLVALRLKTLAKENDILIVENPPLARALFASCELDQEIPAEHYHAVAEVIGYIMKMKGVIIEN